MRSLSLGLVCCAATGCAYRAGSFEHAQQPFAGERLTVGCLDLAVERRADLPIGPVLAYQFANRCDDPRVIDLAALTVVGRAGDGGELALRPFDPRAELRPVALDGRKVGGEALAYPAPIGPGGKRMRAGAEQRVIVELCVDLAPLGGGGPPLWRCFGGAPAVAEVVR